MVHRGTAQARERLNLSLWAYVIMPEHVHVLVWPRESVYEVRLIRTALKVPVQRKALAFLRCQAPDFLERLRDEQPNGDVHYRFWQRGGGYDRNITEPATLRSVIDYIHNNPVRRGLASHTDGLALVKCPVVCWNRRGDVGHGPLVGVE